VTVPEHAAEFVAKWRAREPEMVWAEVFCPRPLKDRFALWGALLCELRAAAFELSDARLVEAKSAWWAEESLRSAQNAPRHPLTQALAATALPWTSLAAALVAATQTESSRPADREAAFVAVAPLANAVAAMEAALFGDDANDDAARAIAVHLLAERLRMADTGQVPLSLLARHGVTSAALMEPEGARALRDWAGELSSALPTRIGGAAPFRRTRMAFDGWLLCERAAGRDRRGVPPLSALRLAWRSARAGANG
jgi:hypothetical protein